MNHYQSHITKLAEQLKCKLVVDKKFRTSAMMYVEFQYVEVPPIENQIDYLINLHELGHVYYGHTQGRPPKQDQKFYFDNGVLRSEAQAWEWALDQHIGDIENASRYFMWDNCLGTYYQWGYKYYQDAPSRLLNGNRHWVLFCYDKPDEYFTSIVNKIQNNLTGFQIPYP